MMVKRRYNITVVGMGYVGISNAVLLAQHNPVVALDIDKKKITLLNQKKSPIADAEVENYLANAALDLTATNDADKAYRHADFLIVAAPTDYNPETNYFNTSIVEGIIADVRKANPAAVIIIKSTVPIGFTQELCEKYDTSNILFSPEFLREGKALYDNLHPSRIIVGGDDAKGRIFAGLLKQASLDSEVSVLLTGPTEAEAIKLFSNTYLAMRVAYFNELDTFAEIKGLDSKKIIQGVSLDPRIGDYYNNPSFGYGGYCLPKDTKQLLANYKNIPNLLISAIVAANDTRIGHVTSMIMAQKPTVVGVYRLTMKNNSDNFRQSSIQSVIHRLRQAAVRIIIHEPSLNQETFESMEVVSDLKRFKERADIIIANRVDAALEDVASKIYSRDLFSRD